MTTDQDLPRLGETMARHHEISVGSDSPLQTKEHVLRARCLRSGVGLVSVGRPRIVVSCRGLGKSPLSESARPATKTDGESPTVRLLSGAHEDIARLLDVLRNHRCAAALRGIDGVTLPIDLGHTAARGDTFKLPGTAPSLSAPIHDAEGGALAFLELSTGDADRSESSEKLLRALIESTARSMTERWFRLTHRRQWIVAALRRNAPQAGMLLAVDRDQRIVAADRGARQFLEQKGRRFDRQLPLTSLFQSSPALLRRRGYTDVSITLRGSGDAEPWIALVTPPDMGAVVSEHDARAMLHVRPRWDWLTRLLSVASDACGRRGLSHDALRRVEEYVDANLDSTLDIGELAGILRMSPSHFTRSFNRSVGTTPHRYVIQCRVAKARELLSKTNLPLTDIALDIGFSDQSHFSRRFQELVGVPPGAYRRRGESGLR
jgi:AraC-like DNA-binding protein